MPKVYNPGEVAPPGGPYSHAIEVPAGARLLFVAGQVGITRDGQVGQGIDEQTRIVFENLGAILKAAGMTMADAVKATVFLTDEDDYRAFAEARKPFMPSPPPANTLVFIKRLADPKLLVEIELVAAKT